jgi:hypothetical protein
LSKSHKSHPLNTNPAACPHRFHTSSLCIYITWQHGNSFRIVSWRYYPQIHALYYYYYLLYK